MPGTLRVADMMKSEVMAITPGTTLQEAREQLLARGTRHMPVIDADRHLVGILSQRDVARALDPQLAAQGRRTTLAVGEVMSTKLVTARLDTPAHEAVAQLLEHKIGAIPVVDASNHLIGLVTETDFLVIAHQALLGIEPQPHAKA